MPNYALCQSIIASLAAEALADAVLRYGGGREKIASVTGTSTATIDLTNGNTQTLTLTANCTLTLTGATTGTSCTLSLYLVQNATGGWSVTWPAGVRWPGGSPPSLTPAASARDLVVLETLDGGTSWDATAVLDFS